MAIQAQNTKLNLIPGGVIPVVNVSQYDVNRTLTFTLYDGDNIASLAAGTTVKVEGTKPSRHAFSYGSPVATISGNVVTVNTADQMTMEAGTVQCKIVLTNGSQVVGTAMFLLECETAGVQDDADISGTVLPVYMEAGRQYMLGSEAWAVGTKDGTAVPSTAPQYHNNSKWWCEQNQGKAEESEAWAVGTKNGTPVPSTASQYHNNSKYYSDIARSRIDAGIAEAESYANQSIDYANKSSNYANQSRVYQERAQTNANQSLNYANQGRQWSKSWATYSYDLDTYGSDLNNSHFWADRSEYFYGKAEKLYQLMQQRINGLIAIIRTLVGSIYITTQSGDRLITQSGDNLVINFADPVYLATEADERILTQTGNNIIVSK